MKQHLSKLLFILVTSFCVNCSANDEIHFVACPKTYVSPEQIDFCENGIFVRINDIVIQTETLSTDAQGVFFANARDDGCGPSQWKCKRTDSRGMVCNTCNWEWNYTCSSCRNEKKQNRFEECNLVGQKDGQLRCQHCFCQAARWYLLLEKPRAVRRH